MSIKSNIRKAAIVAFWSVAGTGILILLVAAINRKNSRTCKSIKIEINGEGPQLFLEQKEVAMAITEYGKDNLIGKTLISFNLKHMEEILRKNPWIRDAQLFFDNNEVLRVKIAEREPMARVFTVGGNSFFIDSGCKQMPLSNRLPEHIPVFTGFPSEKLSVKGTDSALVRQMKTLGWYILNNAFWKAEIEQVDITADRTFEMVPVIGNHLIEFGDGTDCEQKFNRLFIFYRTVLSRTGFDKYSKIDVQYAGQIIGTKRGGNVSRADSLQAIKNISQLIKSAQQLQADTVGQEVTKPLEHNTVTEQTLTGYDLIPAGDDSTEQQNTQGHSPSGSQELIKELPKTKSTSSVKQKPKAVMLKTNK